jgi:hypothetical protein
LLPSRAQNARLCVYACSGCPLGLAREQEAAEVRLDLWLEERRWWRRELPFPHVVAERVFRPTMYAAIESSFREVFARGLTDDSRDHSRFARSMKGYDAYGYRPPRDLDGPLAVFASREWRDLLASVFAVETTEDVEISLHHHCVGGKTGWIHNDLNPAWYVDQPRADGINLSNPLICSYHFGHTSGTDLTPRERIRAVAVLFYLANEPWSPGDGGETGIYAVRSTPADQPVFAMPPHNNSLLAFECTPFSYHTFIANKRAPRNSIVMWLHRPKQHVIERWGEAAIEPWRQ